MGKVRPSERKWFVQRDTNRVKFPICKNNEERQEWQFPSTGMCRIQRKNCSDGGMCLACMGSEWQITHVLDWTSGPNSSFPVPHPHTLSRHFAVPSYHAHCPYPVHGGSGHVICFPQWNANRHLWAQVKVCWHSSTCSLAHLWFSIVKIRLSRCWFKERVETHRTDQNQSWILGTFPLDLRTAGELSQPTHSLPSENRDACYCQAPGFRAVC